MRPASLLSKGLEVGFASPQIVVDLLAVDQIEGIAPQIRSRVSDGKDSAIPSGDSPRRNA
jgi:hypothetical protein